MNNKSLVANTILVVIIVILGGTILTGITQCLHHQPEVIGTYQVKKGDTLFTIVKKNYGEQVNVGEKVYELKEVNHIDDAGMLTPGQSIELTK